MPSTEDSKLAPLTTQTEKPIHYTYLKEFRVEQCPLFLQHKCTQHKPFTCFYWHFMNQRRRRPVRKRDGTFNYSPDVYCTKYDETTGLCPDGDECLYLHRTAGDTERRYHLRYYKTGVCVYDTDSRGYCVKNGPHCAFAHGIHDLRNPVYDVRELQALDIIEEGANGSSGPNSLDKERNALNEDPKWQDSNYVLTNYKTESCKRPPRLCRQGYACPQFHNNRDRRRSPKKYKYRSTPCPNVKQGDEWGDPANCDSGDMCPYCHTRTEQQFHPEIYKSTKCNDIQQTGYCPRGPFCAFAHIDKELSAVRDIGLDNTTNLAAILSNALPSAGCNHSSQNSSTESNMYGLPGPVSRPRSYSTSTNHSGDSVPQYHKAPGCEREDKEASIRRQLQLIDLDQTLDPLEKARRKQNVYISHGLSPASHSSKLSPVTSMLSFSSPYYPTSDMVESVVGNALDDLNLDGISVEASLEKDLELETNNALRTSLTNAGLLGSSAPVTIPGSGSLHGNSALASLSPTLNSPLGSLTHSLGLGANSLPHRNSIDKAAAAFYSHANSFGNSKFGHFSTGVFDYQTPQNMSPGSRVSAQSSPLITSINYNNSTAEVQRLRDELSANRARMMSWEESMAQARTACEVWKREAEDANRREKFVEQQRNDALVKINNLQKEVESISGGPYLRTLASVSELETLPLNQLKHLQEQLRNDLDKVDKVVYHHTANKCMVCEEQSRSVSLMPCSHLVVCSQCAGVQNKCPYCQAEVTHWTNVPISL